MQPDETTRPPAPVSRRGFIVLAAGGIGALAGAIGGAAGASAATSPKLPSEYYRKANQFTTTGVLFDDIAVRINGDAARMFIPQTIKPYTSTPTLVVWLFHGSGSDQNAIVGGFKSTAMAAVNAGGIAICQNAGGTLYSHPTAQALQVAGYSYMSSLYAIQANVLRATSGGGALAHETQGSRLIPNILGSYHVNSVFDLSAMYLDPRGRDSIIAAFGDDPAAIAAANPARLPSSAWAGAKARIVVSQPNSSDTTVPPATNGLEFLSIASSTAAEASLRAHANGHATPGFADADFVATISRWRATVADTTLPQVSITAPAAGAAATGSIVLSAAAFDNLNVSTVTFTVGGVSVPAKLNVDSILVPGYTGATAWIAALDTRLVPNGAASVVATAVDPSGNSVTTAPRPFTVQNADTTPPTIAVTSPSDSAVIAGTVPLSATAADDLAVASVTFTVGAFAIAATQTVGTNVWTASFDSTTAPEGPLPISATTVDAAGNSTTSAPLTVTVNNSDTQAPTIALTSPSDGAIVAGTVPLSATADDNLAVASVAFTVGALTIAATQSAGTNVWTASFDSTTAPEGPLSISATTVDSAGNSTISAPVTVAVNNADTQAPTIAIVAPIAGATVKGIVSAKASASDNRAVQSVAFYAGTRLIGPGTLTADGLWTLTFNTKTSVTPNGTYLVTARATDAAGNVGECPPSSIVIKN